MDFHREILIATSPRRVWLTLTDSHELIRWACDKATVTENEYVLAGASVFGGKLGGKVHERTEGEYLAFEWTLGGVSTEVCIRIVPQTQQGLPPADFARVIVDHRGVPDSFTPSSESSYPKGSMEVTWILWLRRLALWAERAQVTGEFRYDAPLSATVERLAVVEANLATVWNYITDGALRQRWLDEPLGKEVERVERNRVTFEWEQDAPGRVTFVVEPMADERSLVVVHHEGLPQDIRFDYHIGWQDYLIALSRTAGVPVIRQTIWIAAAPLQVWKWFTSEEAMRAWWNVNTVYEPKVGGRISFSDHGADLHGIVTELAAPHRFAFTFVEAGTEGVRDPFVVTADLEPEQDGTRVYLTQSGFDRLPEDVRDRVFAGFQRGWADSPEIYRLEAVSADRAILQT